MQLNIAFLIIAAILFLMGAWSRWWAVDPRGPYYPAIVSLGLFFWVMSALWPLLKS
jgi:hypothetical protein